MSVRQSITRLVEALNSEDADEVGEAISIAQQLMEKGLTERVMSSLASDDEWWKTAPRAFRGVRGRLPSTTEIRRRYVETLPSEWLDVVLDEDELEAVSHALVRLFTRREVAENAVSAFVESGQVSVVGRLAELLRQALDADRNLAIRVAQVLPMVFDGTDPRMVLTRHEYEGLRQARDALRLARHKWKREDYLGDVASRSLARVNRLLREYGKSASEPRPT